MGVDYYNALSITRNASDDDIKDAYRNLSLKFHPQKNKEADAVNIFSNISEAYQVLSDPRIRAAYDSHAADWIQKSGFTRVEPDEVFARFHGTNNPFKVLEAHASSFEAMTLQKSLEGSKRSAFELVCTLEEIYHGCEKQVTCPKTITEEDGSERTETSQFTINVKPGCLSQARFVFHKEGSQTAGKEPGDVVYVLKEAPHPLYKRDGANLIHEPRIPLHKALIGATLNLLMLDGRQLSVSLPNVVHPGAVKVIHGEGMPVTGAGLTGQKGDLHIIPQVIFPNMLSDNQKSVLRAGFLLPTSLTDTQNKAVKEFLKVFNDEHNGWAVGYQKNAPKPS